MATNCSYVLKLFAFWLVAYLSVVHTVVQEVSLEIHLAHTDFHRRHCPPTVTKAPSVITKDKGGVNTWQMSPV